MYTSGVGDSRWGNSKFRDGDQLGKVTSGASVSGLKLSEAGHE